MKNFLLLSIISLLFGCAGSTIDNTHDKETLSTQSVITKQHDFEVLSPINWSAKTQVSQVRHLYFSNQPDEQALQTAKANGVTAVINLRSPNELEWNEESVVKDLGMEYLNVPIQKESVSFNAQAIKRIDDFISARPGLPVLLHCSSGNRASAWLAIHLAKAHGLSNAQAIEKAQQAGMDSSDIEDRVKTYLME